MIIFLLLSSSRYSYGKSVIGKLTTTICVSKKRNWRYWYSRKEENNRKSCKTITRKVSFLYVYNGLDGVVIVHVFHENLLQRATNIL